MKLFSLLVITFLAVSCDRSYYVGGIAVEKHLWELKKIDTLYRVGKNIPSALWYNSYNGLYYSDIFSEFPYPYSIGMRLYNFDKK